MRYVLLKGLEGFGDRLQCLLQAIGYAQFTGRCLVVDWRDSHWSHNQDLPFEHYFHIEGVQTLSLQDFTCIFRDLSPISLSFPSVVPEAWAARLLDPNYESFIRQPAFALPGNGECLNDIISGHQPDFHHAIVVYPGIGQRHFKCHNAKYVRPTPIVTASLQMCVNQYSLCDGQYDVVHFRGGTKIWAGGAMQKDSPNYHKHVQWDSAHHYLQEIYDVLHQIRDGAPPCPLYVLTDTPNLAHQWIREFEDATLVHNSAHGCMGDTGIHKISRHALNSIQPTGSPCLPRLTKEILNVEAIRDFVLMNHARFLVGDGVSTFSYLAYGFKMNNIYLAPLPPVVSPLEAAGQWLVGSENRWCF